jgi:hypothetical protein
MIKTFSKNKDFKKSSIETVFLIEKPYALLLTETIIFLFFVIIFDPGKWLNIMQTDHHTSVFNLLFKLS